MQHVPFRNYFEYLDELDCELPSVEDEIKLINMYGARTLAVALNADGGDAQSLVAYQRELSEKLEIPVIRPLQEGVGSLLAVIRKFLQLEPI